MNLARNGAPRLWRQPSLQLGRQRAFGSMIGGGGTAEQDQLPTGGTRAQELRGHSCKGSCPGAEALLPSPKIEDEMRALPLWKLNDEKTMISKSFVAKNFVKAIEFFNGVKDVAEEEGHHPDLHLTGYRNVTVTLSTHAAGGLTTNDFVVAAKIDAVPVVYSPKWVRSQLGSA